MLKKQFATIGGDLGCSQAVEFHSPSLLSIIPQLHYHSS